MPIAKSIRGLSLNVLAPAGGVSGRRGGETGVPPGFFPAGVQWLGRGEDVPAAAPTGLATKPTICATGGGLLA